MLGCDSSRALKDAQSRVLLSLEVRCWPAAFPRGGRMTAHDTAALAWSVLCHCPAPGTHMALAPLQTGRAPLAQLSVLSTTETFRGQEGDGGFRLAAVAVVRNRGGVWAHAATGTRAEAVQQRSAPALHGRGVCTLQRACGGSKPALTTYASNCAPAPADGSILVLDAVTPAVSDKFVVRTSGGVEVPRACKHTPPARHLGAPHACTVCCRPPAQHRSCNHPHSPQPQLSQVKTQRACSDYRKVEFAHASAKITDLRYIGLVTSQRLKTDAKLRLGEACPLNTVTTVEELKAVVDAAASNP